MTRVELDQLQEYIQQSQALVELAVETAHREQSEPAKGDHLSALLNAAIWGCENAASMAECVYLNHRDERK